MALSYLTKTYTADFETTTDPMDLRVWAWGLYNLGLKTFNYNNTLDSFVNYLKYHIEDKAVIYFHNLKFDGEFLFYYLFDNGFEWTDERKIHHRQFSTLISNMGVFYAIKINWDGKIITILDSLKLIPLKVKDIPKAFNLTMKKGELDYKKYRPVGYEPQEDEVDYLKDDCQIVGEALKFFFDQCLTKMTVAGNALSDYKLIFTKGRYERCFPYLPDDDLLRKSYKGGVVQVKEELKNKDIGEGVTLDVNSLYPYVMYSKKLPYGEPIHEKGKLTYCEFYDVGIQRLVCNFNLKEGYLPTLQIKKHFRFKETEYLKSSDGEDVVLTLTNVDIEQFFEHYEVTNLEYIEGWKFRSSFTLFKDYIDKWIDVKNIATVDGNAGLRTLAKLMLNSLYGKFGLNPNVQSKIPYYDRDDTVKYRLGKKEKRNPIYVPVASFVTAYARQITLGAAQLNYERFIYCDTDSLHLLGTEIPTNLWVDPVAMGAWKVEGTFTRARFIRAKTYVEEIDGHLDIKCAGLPDQCKEFVTYENFKPGLVIGGKLQQKRAKGGVYLKEIEFSIEK
jgi:hypothetical protein